MPTIHVFIPANERRYAAEAEAFFGPNGEAAVMIAEALEANDVPHDWRGPFELYVLSDACLTAITINKLPAVADYRRALAELLARTDDLIERMLVGVEPEEMPDFLTWLGNERRVEFNDTAASRMATVH
jgi:hypothetical protein